MYQLVEFGDVMTCGSKDIFKNTPYLISCTNTHHSITDLLNHGMVKIQIFEYLDNKHNFFTK